MHIVFVTAVFANNLKKPLTGMPAYIEKITRLLKKNGHTVEIIAGAKNSSKWSFDGIKVYNCKCVQQLGDNFFTIAQNVFQRECILQKKLKEINFSQKVDIVQYAGWSGVGIGHSISCPSVLRLTTYSKITYKENESWGKVAKYFSVWERMAGRKVDYVISPSILLKETFSREIHKRVYLMETPYDSSVNEDTKIFEQKLANKKYILFYGSASKNKGFETISDMMPCFLRKHPEAYFVVAGWDVETKKGSAIQVLKNKLGEEKNRFIFLGPQLHETLYPIIRNAQVVLIPSLADNLPNTCLEALSLDQIVIGTYDTSLEQLIKNEINGFLSIPGDYKDLLEATEKAYRLTQEERNKLIQNSQIILRKYNPEYAVDKLIRFYEWCLANNKVTTRKIIRVKK